MMVILVSVVPNHLKTGHFCLVFEWSTWLAIRKPDTKKVRFLNAYCTGDLINRRVQYLRHVGYPCNLLRLKLYRYSILSKNRQFIVQDLLA